MARPRSTLIDLNATPYYHCIARCVRRAFLCGEDKFSGRNFDHRKQWVVDRIHLLGQLFAIDIAAYAIMSNHYHLVLHVNKTQAENWSDDEVIHRWLNIYKGPELVHRYQRQLPMTEAELLQVQTIITTWRERLCSISWFMALLNEQIAREANKEDGCTGRFWEGRFKSQALLDETAILSCMVYVDLNPVRAALADDLEASDFTSIQARLQQIRQIPPEAQQPELMPFIESEHESKTLAAIPYTLKDYIELVDWSSKAVRNDKRGSIKASKPKIITSIGLNEEQWLTLALNVQKKSRNMLSGLGVINTSHKKSENQFNKSA